MNLVSKNVKNLAYLIVKKISNDVYGGYHHNAHENAFLYYEYDNENELLINQLDYDDVDDVHHVNENENVRLNVNENVCVFLR